MSLFGNSLQTSQVQQWWIKVMTAYPSCTYYFGPFDTAQEAYYHQAEYLQDIQEEGAEGISTIIEKGHPHQLTIFDENNDTSWVKPTHVQELTRYLS